MDVITLKAMPFDSNELFDENGDMYYDRAVYSKDLAEWLATYFSNGILVKGGEILAEQLQVVADSGLACKVKAGAVLVNGRTGWLEEEATITVNVGGSMPRIDRVVAELNLPDDRGIYIKVLEGVPAENPEAPAIMQTDDVWQMPLATVRVEAASAVISEVVDTRDEVGISQVLIGVQPPLRPTGDSAENIKVTDETAFCYGHENTPDNPLTADDAFAFAGENIGAQAIYLSLVGNVNTNMTDAALGYKNDNISGLGMALAMYSRYKDEVLEMDELERCRNFNYIKNNGNAKRQLMSSNAVFDLIKSKTFITDMLYDSFQESLNNSYGASCDIEITQDHVDGKKMLYIWAYVHNLQTSNANTYIKLNDVMIFEKMGPSQYTFQGVIDLEEYNMNAVGTYKLELSGYRTSSYQVISL